MAKKKTDIEITFKTLSQIKKENASVEWLPLNNPALDYLFGKGMPRGRIIEIYGPESGGKTTLALCISEAFIAAKGIVLYIDVERAMTPDRYTLACRTPDSEKRFFVVEVPTVEEVFTAIEKFLYDHKKKEEPLLIVWDSLAQTSSLSEVEKNLTEQDFSRRAIVISKALRSKIVPMLANQKASLIVINQMRDNVGVLYGDKEMVPGGRATKFAYSIRVKIGKVGKIEEGKKKKGIITKLRIIKNKIHKPELVSYIGIDYEKGISAATSAFWTLEQYGKIKKVSKEESYSLKIGNIKKVFTIEDFNNVYLKHKKEINSLVKEVIT